MDINQARAIASSIKDLFPEIVIRGVRTVDGEKALVLRLARRDLTLISPENVPGRLAKLVGVKGHRFVTLNVCSLCYHEVKNSFDGHYHERMVQYSTTSAAAEPLCCKCLRRAGIDCAKVGYFRKAVRESKLRKTGKTGKTGKTVGRR